MLPQRLFPILLGLSLVAAGGPTTKAPRARSESERLVRRYYEDVAGRAEQAEFHKAVDEILSEDFIFTFGNRADPTRGIEAHKRWLTWHHRVAADQVWTIQDLVSQSDSAAVRFLLTFNHQDDLYGIRATGKTVKIRGMDLFRISAGRIVELYRVFDGRDVVEQLGFNCPPSKPPPPVTPRP